MVERAEAVFSGRRFCSTFLYTNVCVYICVYIFFFPKLNPMSKAMTGLTVTSMKNFVPSSTYRWLMLIFLSQIVLIGSQSSQMSAM